MEDAAEGRRPSDPRPGLPAAAGAERAPWRAAQGGVWVSLAPTARSLVDEDVAAAPRVRRNGAASPAQQHHLLPAARDHQLGVSPAVRATGFPRIVCVNPGGR